MRLAGPVWRLGGGEGFGFCAYPAWESGTFGFAGLPHPLGGHSCPHCDPKLLPMLVLQGAPSGLFYLCLEKQILTGIFQDWVAIFRERFRVFPCQAQLPFVRGSLRRGACVFSSAVSKVRFLAKSSPLLQLGTAFVSVNLTPIEGEKHGAGVIWLESTLNWAKTIIVMPQALPFHSPTCLHRSN